VPNLKFVLPISSYYDRTVIAVISVCRLTGIEIGGRQDRIGSGPANPPFGPGADGRE
jgi:hypothetical protein